MKVHHSPQVDLVGRQQVTDAGLQRFLDNQGIVWETDTTSEPQELVEIAGRLCYMSFSKPRPGGNEAYLKHIQEVGHGSVTEHACWNFIISGISRSCSHELVRHRAGWAYSQLSQRYVDESVAEYVEPECIASDPELHQIWHEAVLHAHEAYCKLVGGLATKFATEPDATLRRKLARQAARSVLPNATETKIFVTANARAIRNFIELRASRHAEVEIRKVANKMWQILKDEAPTLFGDYVITPIVDCPEGTFELITPHRKI
jgi:thymidylate synthase (FAD)